LPAIALRAAPTGDRTGAPHRRGRRGKLGTSTRAAMFELMLIDAPDDRYRERPSGTPWRRVLQLLAGAVACFLIGAFVLPWIGFLLDIGAGALVLLALCALDD
jgi:hypothetical protein